MVTHINKPQLLYSRCDTHTTFSAFFFGNIDIGMSSIVLFWSLMNDGYRHFLSLARITLRCVDNSKLGGGCYIW